MVTPARGPRTGNPLLEGRLHLLVDGWGAAPDRLDDAGLIRELLRQAAAKVGGRVVHLHVHAFTPRGLTGFALLAESHLAIHTWPESGHFAADLFFCGTTDLDPAVDHIRATLAPREMHVKTIERADALGSDLDANEVRAACSAD